jgi:hypothetical protein
VMKSTPGKLGMEILLVVGAHESAGVRAGGQDPIPCADRGLASWDLFFPPEWISANASKSRWVTLTE